VTLPAPAASALLRAERWADLSVLVSGFLLGVAGAAVVLAVAFARSDTRLILSIGIYVVGLLAMLGSSLAYHAAAGSPRRWLLRRLDHAGVFAMIAGSATPFALCGSAPVWGIAVTLALWAAAAVGMVVKLRSPIGRPKRSVIIYLTLGWFSVIAIGPSIPAVTALRIAAGGILYTVGVGFYLWRRLPFHSAIWHGFVLAGATCHYWAIVDGVVFA
jgi:hemolysin III